MHKQLHKAAAPILCGGFGLFWRLVPVRVCCSTFYLNRSTANTSLGRTHERPHVEIYTTRIHGASHRIAAQRSRCYVNNLSLFLPSHPACTGAASSARPHPLRASAGSLRARVGSPHTLLLRRRGAGADAAAQIKSTLPARLVLWSKLG